MHMSDGAAEMMNTRSRDVQGAQTAQEAHQAQRELQQAQREVQQAQREAQQAQQEAQRAAQQAQREAQQAVRQMQAELARSSAREAPDGARGVALAVESEPDLALVDLMMPGELDGMGVLTAFREKVPDVPVVMMSGRAGLSDAVRATKLGAFTFLEKPLTP